MTQVSQVNILAGAYSSVYDGHHHLFEGGDWSTDARLPAFAEGMFDGIYRIHTVKLEWAGTDMTPDGSLLELALRNPDGGYAKKPFFTVRDTLINRGPGGALGFSTANSNPPPMKSGYEVQDATPCMPPLVHTFAQPVEAVAVQLRIQGHGWLGASNLAVEGELVRAFTVQEAAEYLKQYARNSRLY
jgi:hypothetical protein